MARLLILSKPGDPRQGAFLIDAADQDAAFESVMRDGLGDVIWSVTKPKLNESIIQGFGPATSQRVRQHVTKLQADFAGAGSVMLRESLPQRITRGAGEFAKRSALPVGGGMVGGLAGPFMGIPSAVGSAIGGGVGEAINQVLGVTKFDIEQIILAAASGGSARAGGLGAAQVAKTGPTMNLMPLARRLPGGQGALTQMAGEALRNMPTAIEAGTQVLLGDETINRLFDFALRQAPRVNIPARNIRIAVEKGLATEGIAKRFGFEFKGLSEQFRKIREQTTVGSHFKTSLKDRAIPINEFEILRKRVGTRMQRLSIDNSERDALRSLYRGIMTDLEKAATTGAAPAALLTGVKVARREFAARDLSDFLEQKVFGNPRADGLRPISIGKLKKELDNMAEGRPSNTFELFEDSLRLDEIDEMQRVVDLWSDTLAPLPPPRGVQFGSGPTAAAGATGFMVGGGAGAAGAVLAKQILTISLMSENGRAALVKLLKRGQPLNLVELSLAIAGQGIREQLSPSRQFSERFAAPRIESNR